MHKLKEKIDKLYEVLALNKNESACLLKRITHAKSNDNRIDQKFLDWVSKLNEHIAEEKRLMLEIESVEQKHEEMKLKGMLKSLQDNNKPKKEDRLSFAKLLLLWLVFRSKTPVQTNQN